MPINLQEIINGGTLDALATVYQDPTAATVLLTGIGFPASRRPAFPLGGDPRTFWANVCQQIENGILEGGFEALLAAAARDYPRHPIFSRFRQQNPSSDPLVKPQPRVSGQPHDAFLSFSSRDRSLIATVAEGLTSRGVKVWFDQDSLKGGEAYVRTFEQILQQVPTVVVFYGVEGYGPWQEAEADVVLGRANRRECLLIPVLLPGVSLANLPPFLSRFHSLRIASPAPSDLHPTLDELARLIIAERRP